MPPPIVLDEKGQFKYNGNVKLDRFEKIEDLGHGLKLIQSEKEYRFTTDAVLLANVVSDLTGRTAVDLGCGGGILSVLLAAKKHAEKVVGVEIQSQLADMARRSVELNGLSDVVEILCAPMQEAHSLLKTTFDCVVCNPPYRRRGSGERQLAENLALCRHELAVTLEEAIESGARLLNSKGSFYLVHQAERLAEICYLMKKHRVEPKEILPVCPKTGAEPNLVIVRGVFLGKVGCVLKSPLYVCDEKGNYVGLVKTFYE